MITSRNVPGWSQRPADLESLYPPSQSDTVAVAGQALTSSAGIVVVAGRTGDGKSTTLAAMVSHAANPDRKVVTLENPVEALIPGTQQIPISDDTDFGETLRAVLRSDTDVVMIGEICDEETAKLAVEAAETGQLVLTTIRTFDATDAPSKMLKLGVDPKQLADQLRLVLAQRLVKQLCQECQTGGQPVGCEACDEGYAGRVAIAETLVIDSDAQVAVMQGASPAVLRETKNYRPFHVHADTLLAEQQTTRTELIQKLGTVLDT